jgi:hypothetical protein
MKWKAIWILLMGMVASACVCGDEEPETRIPSCMQRKISKIESEPVRNPAASVTMIITTDKTYFYIPPYCCDFYGELYDDQCNLVCNPEGGITGSGNGDCPDYTAVEEIVIWEDKR